jgi:hypothetical protein
LVRDRYIEKCTHASAALYLFLVCVSDDKGLSYYGDESIMKMLAMDSKALEHARNNLISIGLIAWKKPLYQVLSLEPQIAAQVRPGTSLLSLGDILRKAREVTP